MGGRADGVRVWPIHACLAAWKEIEVVGCQCMVICRFQKKDSDAAELAKTPRLHGQKCKWAMEGHDD